MSPYDQANLGFVDNFWGDGEYGSSAVGVGTIPGNGRETQEQNYFELLPGSGMTAGFHYKNCILGM